MRRQDAYRGGTTTFRTTKAALLVLALSALVVPSAAAEPATAGWQLESPPVSPPASTGRAMAYDPGSDRVVLLTADPADEHTSQTWAWDGTTWAQLHPSTNPPARWSSVLAYDQAHDELLLFGGYTREGSINDTWTFADGEWTQRHPAFTPSVDHGGSAAFDPHLGKIILVGGETGGGGASRLMWSWDGSNWASMGPAMLPVGGREAAGFAYDESRDALVLFGGRSHGPSYSDFFNDTWVWDGETWTELRLRRHPRGRAWASMASFGQRVAVFGGTNYWRPGHYGDTWVLGEHSWRKVKSGSEPEDRADAEAAWDPTRNELVLFGGDGETPGDVFDETWTLSKGRRPLTT